MDGLEVKESERTNDKNRPNTFEKNIYIRMYDYMSEHICIRVNAHTHTHTHIEYIFIYKQTKIYTNERSSQHQLGIHWHKMKTTN